VSTTARRLGSLATDARALQSASMVSLSKAFSVLGLLSVRVATERSLDTNTRSLLWDIVDLSRRPYR
jgi:hypothetical protein